SRRRHTRSKRDWSSDVCSSDLAVLPDLLRCCRCSDGTHHVSPASGVAAAARTSEALFAVGGSSQWPPTAKTASDTRTGGAWRRVGVCAVGGGGWARQASGQLGGTRSRSANHAAAPTSEGARHSPRGDSAPPRATFGPFGIAVRLNWLA